MYALFKNEKQIGSPFHSKKEVWEAALIEGLVKDVPVADEEDGQCFRLDIMSAGLTKLATADACRLKISLSSSLGRGVFKRFNIH